MNRRVEAMKSSNAALCAAVILIQHVRQVSRNANKRLAPVFKNGQEYGPGVLKKQSYNTSTAILPSIEQKKTPMVLYSVSIKADHRQVTFGVKRILVGVAVAVLHVVMETSVGATKMLGNGN